MFWDRIIERKMVSSWKVPNYFKMTVQTYIDLYIEGSHGTMVQETKLFRNKSFLCTTILHHSWQRKLINTWIKWVSKIFIKKKKLAFSPDLNLIENLWCFLKRKVYIGRWQFTSKYELWNAVHSVSHEEIHQLTSLMNLKLISESGANILY